MLSTETARTIPPNPRREGHAARGIAGFICQYVRGAGIEVFNVLLKKRLITFPPLSPFMFLTCMKECSSLSPILSTEPTGTIPANLHHSELREPVGHSFAQSFPQSRAHACKVWYERSCELDKRSSFERVARGKTNKPISTRRKRASATRWTLLCHIQNALFHI